MRSFNNLEYFENLKSSGLEEKESEAIIKSIENMIRNSGIVNESDIINLKKDIKIDLINLKMELQSFIIKTVMTAVMLLGSLQTIYHFF